MMTYNMGTSFDMFTKTSMSVSGFVCLFEHCMPQALECGKDFSCIKSLACILGCGENNLGCNLNCEIR